MEQSVFLVRMGYLKSAKESYLTLEIGLLVFSVSYFLFTFHGLFTLAWVGEWNLVSGTFSLWLFITDIAATATLIFRVIGSFMAVSGMIAYFIKRSLSRRIAFRLLKLILVCEAIYWLGLLASGIGGILPVTPFYFDMLLTSGIPCTVAALAIPVALFKLVTNLSSEKPKKNATKWGLIAGATYIFVFWLNNSVMWLYTIMYKGIDYLTAYPQNLFSFCFTIVGLFVLALFASYFAKTTAGASNLQAEKLRVIGTIITALGMYFLVNYLLWIFFPAPWSSWYAWFLGHNLDLWFMTATLVGIPLIYYNRIRES